MFLKIWKLVFRTFTIWGEANASRMSAALTYYTMLSLAPTLMIAIAIAGYVYDNQLAESEIVEQVKAFTTPEIAQTVAGLIKNASRPESGLIAGTISVCILVFAASGVFTQLYDTMNDIWEVSMKDKNGFLLELQKRLIGIAMVLIMGVLLITTLLLNSAITYLTSLVDGKSPVLVSWLSFADQGLSYLLIPTVFMFLFWFFPATKVSYRDVWPAGVLTAVLFAGSHYLIKLYLEFSTTSEVYGAAGSLVILLVWVYITGMVVFFGASFSRAWALTFGSRSAEASESDVANSHKSPTESMAGEKLATKSDPPVTPPLRKVDPLAKPVLLPTRRVD